MARGLEPVDAAALIHEDVLRDRALRLRESQWFGCCARAPRGDGDDDYDDYDDDNDGACAAADASADKWRRLVASLEESLADADTQVGQTGRGRRAALAAVCAYLRLLLENGVGAEPSERSVPSASLRAAGHYAYIAPETRNVASTGNAYELPHWECAWLGRLQRAPYREYEEVLELGLLHDVAPLVDLLAFDFAARIDKDWRFALHVSHGATNQHALTAIRVWLYVHLVASIVVVSAAANTLHVGLVTWVVACGWLPYAHSMPPRLQSCCVAGQLLMNVLAALSGALGYLGIAIWVYLLQHVVLTAMLCWVHYYHRRHTRGPRSRGPPCRKVGAANLGREPAGPAAHDSCAPRIVEAECPNSPTTASAYAAAEEWLVGPESKRGAEAAVTPEAHVITIHPDTASPNDAARVDATPPNARADRLPPNAREDAPSLHTGGNVPPSLARGEEGVRAFDAEAFLIAHRRYARSVFTTPREGATAFPTGGVLYDTRVWAWAGDERGGRWLRRRICDVRRGEYVGKVSISAVCNAIQHATFVVQPFRHRVAALRLGDSHLSAVRLQLRGPKSGEPETITCLAASRFAVDHIHCWRLATELRVGDRLVCVGSAERVTVVGREAFTAWADDVYAAIATDHSCAVAVGRVGIAMYSQ